MVFTVSEDELKASGKKFEDFFAEDVDSRYAIPGFTSVYIMNPDLNGECASEYFQYGEGGDALALRLFDLSLAKKIVNVARRGAQRMVCNVGGNMYSDGYQEEIFAYLIEVGDCSDAQTNISPDLIELLQSIVGSWKNCVETEVAAS